MSEQSKLLTSVEQTRTLGRSLGGLLQRGDFVALEGELGAGKTEMVRAICAGAGVDLAQVSSPTFAIVAEYRSGRVPIFHADLYRLADVDELYATGFFDLLDQGASLVEWIDRVPQAAPEDRLWLTLKFVGVDERQLIANAQGPRSTELLEKWWGHPPNL